MAKAFLFSTNTEAFKGEIGTINKDLTPPELEIIKKA
jgi:hypothetical protein